MLLYHCMDTIACERVVFNGKTYKQSINKLHWDFRAVRLVAVRTLIQLFTWPFLVELFKKHGHKLFDRESKGSALEMIVHK